MDNEITFTPVWLKAIRDLTTVAAVLYISRKTNAPGAFLRRLTCLSALLYVGLGIQDGAGAVISVRGVIWTFPLIWAATADKRGVVRLASFCSRLISLVVPVAIPCSLALGFFGHDFYFEAIGMYQRNPGLFLTPSATAFFAIVSLLYTTKGRGVARASAFFMGIITLSGIFYINTVLWFGRLPRYVYLTGFAAIMLAAVAIGPDDYIAIISQLASGARESIAIQLTLSTRILTIQDAIAHLTWLGNYPVGLNLAANNGLEHFFPDNALLAAVYAFGIVGLAGTILLFLAAWKTKVSGIFILLFTASFFYVWFESSLFAVLVGTLLNPRMTEAAMHADAKKIVLRRAREQAA